MFYFCECLYHPYQVLPRNLRYEKAMKSRLKCVEDIWYWKKNYIDNTFRRICAVPMSIFFDVMLKTEFQESQNIIRASLCHHTQCANSYWQCCCFEMPHVTSISKSLYLLNFSKILRDTLVSLGTESMRKQILSLWFFAIISGLFARLSCQYGCQNPIKWWHFCFQWLLVVYVPTNCFHVADRRFYTNTTLSMKLTL